MPLEASQFKRSRPEVYERARVERTKARLERMRERRERRNAEEAGEKIKERASIETIKDILRDAMARRETYLELDHDSPRTESELYLAREAYDMIFDVKKRAKEDWADYIFHTLGRWPGKKERQEWEEHFSLKEFLYYLDHGYKNFLTVMDDQEWLKIQRALSRLITSELKKDS